MADIYASLDCIVAIAPETAGRVRVRLSVDGEPAVSRSLTARSPAARVELNLRGVKTLTIHTQAIDGFSGPIIVGHPRLLPVAKEDKPVDKGIL